MSIRTSVILVVSLVMVAGYVFFIQIRETVEVQDEPPWFYNVDMDDMTRISINDRGEEAVFFLGEDNRWHLDDPNGLPAGFHRWGGINLLLSGPKSRRLLDVQPTNLEPYGLDSPPVIIDVDLKDGRHISVLLGFTTPDGVGVYAQIEGFSQVFTIVAGWGDVMTRLIHEPPYPLWYYNLDITTLTGIELRTLEKTIGLVVDDVGWNFDNQAQTPVNEAQLASIFAALEQPSQALVEYRVSDLVQYGLDEPSLSLFLQTKYRREDGINVTKETLFRIGNPTEDGTRYYAHAVLDEEFPDVFVVNADWVKGLLDIVANTPYLSDVTQKS